MRKLLLPAFLPKAIRHWSDEACALAISLIKGFQGDGGCEFMHAFAYQLPIIIFLKIVDLPLDHREQLLGWVNTNLRSPDADARLAARVAFNDYIAKLMDERRAYPGGDDIMSRALNADLGEGRMDRERALGFANTLLGGGLDTVASTLGWIAWFLAQSPAHRRRLIEEPKVIPRAIDELMRRFSIANIARVVRDDMAFDGTALRAGEQVLMASCIHDLDPASFPDPCAARLPGEAGINPTPPPCSCSRSPASSASATSAALRHAGYARAGNRVSR